MPQPFPDTPYLKGYYQPFGAEVQAEPSPKGSPAPSIATAPIRSSRRTPTIAIMCSMATA